MWETELQGAACLHLLQQHTPFLFMMTESCLTSTHRFIRVQEGEKSVSGALRGRERGNAADLLYERCVQLPQLASKLSAISSQLQISVFRECVLLLPRRTVTSSSSCTVLASSETSIPALQKDFSCSQLCSWNLLFYLLNSAPPPHTMVVWIWGQDLTP